VVLAGQRPGVDPLAAAAHEKYKAIVPVGGRPMLERVLTTLLDTPGIARIVVLAQEPEALAERLPLTMAEDPRIAWSQSSAGISRSIRAVAGSDVAPWPVLVTTADHALLTRAMVEAFLAKAQGDVALAMVERATIMAAYPHTSRTWLKFADGAFSGANLFALCSPAAARALDLWAEAEQDRKKAWKLFLHFGPLLAIGALLRLVSLEGALARAGRRIGLDARLVTLEIAEAAIDVDKLSDLGLAELILGRRRPTIAGF
jgi:GTP:adenosylcobinamide-phosphate guanylyltransferase